MVNQICSVFRFQQLTLTTTRTSIPIADAGVVRLDRAFDELSFGLYLLARHINNFTQRRLQFRVLNHFFFNWLQWLHQFIYDLVLICILDLRHLILPIKLVLLRDQCSIPNLIISAARGPRSLYQFFEVIEANDYARNIIESLLVDAFVETSVHSGATSSMHGLR